ncbi:MAG: patatin-like phospholipase family protein [bacterium]
MNNRSNQENRPKISVVLSSGSIKALSSSALFDFLTGNNIPIDCLIGCSGGGVYASLHAAGYNTEQMIAFSKEASAQKIVKKMDYHTLLHLVDMPFGQYDLSKGLVKQEPLLQFAYKMFGDRQIEDLPIKTYLQTTDIQTGESIVLDKGSLAQGVYASGAIYPLFPPIFLQNRWLVDGSFTAVLPVMEAIKQGADIIIAMLFHEKPNPNPSNFMESYRNVSRVFSDSLVRSQLALSIDLHHYEIIVINVVFDKTIPLSDAKFIPYLLEMGEQAVELKKEDIMAAIQNYQK